MINNTRSGQTVRLIVQAAALLLIIGIGINHAAGGNPPLPFLRGVSLHGTCPFGGVVSVYRLATEGLFVQKIHESALVVMALVFILAILLGPVFCGWVCPLGTVQEFAGKLGRKIFGKSYNNFVPRQLDKVLRYARYPMLAWVLYATAVTGRLIFAGIDPYHALFGFGREPALGGVVIAGLTLVGALFVERPWCKYACPYGALLGLFNLVRVFKLKRDSDTCINCRLCEHSCPMNIEICSSRVVRDTLCISCMKCTSGSQCRVKDALEFKM